MDCLNLLSPPIVLATKMDGTIELCIYICCLIPWKRTLEGSCVGGNAPRGNGREMAPTFIYFWHIIELH